MRIAVCEDSPLDMERILDLCEAYALKAGYVFHLATYAHADQLLADPEALEADIMLLDIMMPCEKGEGPAGITLARCVRERGYAGSIIFTTTSEEFYAQGFEVGAAHYLIKPLTGEAVTAALDRVVKLVKDPQRIITVPVNRIQMSIPQSLIRYAEVFGRETQLYTTTEQLRVLLPLKKIERLLDGAPFLRCYRSYIINMDYVKAMEDEYFVLQGDVRIPITLRARQSIREKFFAYRLSQVQ